jgi:hypothetical protein
VPASSAAALPSASNLAELLATAPALDEGIVAEARRRPPDEVVRALEALVEEGLEYPNFSQPAVRAVHLAAELRLAGAVPALVRCLGHLSAGTTFREAVLSALVRLGPAAIDGLLAAHGACDGAVERSELAEVLAAIPGDDPRIRAALLHDAGEAPGQAALLARRGDWRAVPGLLAALDRHLAEPPADCPLCTSAGLETLAAAVCALGGTISAAQATGIDALVDRADFAFGSWDEEGDEEGEEAEARKPAVRRKGPGRNDPCWCGSGKKYKRCHLDEDAAAARQ